MTGKSQNMGTSKNSFGRHAGCGRENFLAGAAPLHEGRLAGTKAPPQNRRAGAVFEDGNRAFPPGAQIGGLVPACMCAGSGLKSSPILYESFVFRLRPLASKSRLAECGLQSPTRGRTLLHVPQQERGQLGVEALLGPKVLEQQAVLGSGVVRDASGLQERAPRHQRPLIFLGQRQGQYFRVKQGMPFLTFRRPRWPSQQEPFGMGPVGRLNGLICLSGVPGAAVWRLAEEGPQLGRLSEVFLPMLFMRRSLRVQRSGSG